MKKRTFIYVLTAPLIGVAIAGYLFINKDSVVSAQSDVIAAADKATKTNIEYIKETQSEGNYIIRIRDKEKLTEITEEYLNDELQSKLIISENGKRVTSIGRDYTGKLIGTTWTLPDNLALENKRLLEISLFEKQKEELTDQRWTQSSKALTDNSHVKTVTSETEDRKEIVSIDENTGLPIKREILTKDDDSNWNTDTIKIEEYRYLDSIPMELQSIEDQIDIKERPAPIIEDKPLEG